MKSPWKIHQNPPNQALLEPSCAASLRRRSRNCPRFASCDGDSDGNGFEIGSGWAARHEKKKQQPLSHSATTTPEPRPTSNPKPKGNITHWATQSLYQSGWSEIFANAHSIVKSRTEAPKFGEQKYSEMMTHQLVFTMDTELLAENDKLKWATKIADGIGVETRIPALSSTMLR